MEEANRLAREAEELRDQTEQTARQAVERAMQCGQLLLEVKEACPHGAFQTHLRTMFDATERTAQRYMKLAKNPQLAAGASSIRDAMKLLAPAKTEPVEPPADDRDQAKEAERAGDGDGQPAEEPMAAEVIEPPAARTVDELEASGDVVSQSDLDGIARDIRTAEAALREFVAAMGPMLADGALTHAHTKPATINSLLRQMREALSIAKPRKVCPYCQGRRLEADGRRCRWCLGGGYLTNHLAKQQRVSDEEAAEIGKRAGEGGAA